MLVLSRQQDQSVMLGEKVEVVVLAIRSDRVILVIYAPTELLPTDAERKSPDYAVVTLRRDETLRLGPDIEITLVDIIRGDKARLAFDCWPPEMPIHRKEVWEAIRRERGEDRGPL